MLIKNAYSKAVLKAAWQIINLLNTCKKKKTLLWNDKRGLIASHSQAHAFRNFEKILKLGCFSLS